jgi:uncharacterized NAD(P)/FAD-binding protein YdhS
VTTRRVAIVGLGPKGFGCLERLAIEVARSARVVEVDVTVYDPAPHPGAGPIYDPAQPADLLLNFAARHVDVWSPDHDLVPASRRPDLVTWLERRHPAWASADAYVPRRFLGDYLREAYATLLAALPPTLRVTHVAAVVEDLSPVGAGWRVHTAGPGAADLAGTVVDEVVITAGHGTWTADLGADAWAATLPASDATRVVRTVLPVADRLGPAAVPAAATVGMRGFALTFVDATLALTAGRGGRFLGLDGPRPRYLGSGQDVGRILPSSRSGLPLHAKPGPELTQRAGGAAPIWADVSTAIRAARRITLDEVCARLCEGASRALRLLRPAATATAEAEVHATMTALRSPPPPLATVEPAPPGHSSAAAGTAMAAATMQTMCRSVAVAQGRRAPDARFAVAEAWRQVYPALVERIGHGGLPTTEVPSFRHLARGMERLAFGPPAENLARIGALVHAGVVDLRLVRAPRVVAVDGRLALAAAEGACDPADPVFPVPLDVLVNAVIPPPGVHHDTPLLWRLKGRGAVRTGAGGAGLEVDPSAACIGVDGAATPGLSAIGRATEGWVLGNDTLSRRLHPETRGWAHRIVATAADHLAARPLRRPVAADAGTR